MNKYLDKKSNLTIGGALMEMFLRIILINRYSSYLDHI